jgi:hypothetical protein
MVPSACRSSSTTPCGSWRLACRRGSPGLACLLQTRALPVAAPGCHWRQGLWAATRVCPLCSSSWPLLLQLVVAWLVVVVVVTGG